MHPEAGRAVLASLPVPPGATKEQVALGDRIFHGEAAGGTCTGCHGSDAKGSPQAPSLINGKWLQSAGSLMRITRTIKDGVPKPKNFSVPMPPRGGAPLSDSDVTAVAAYVFGRSAIRAESKQGCVFAKRRYRAAFAATIDNADGWLWP